MTMFWDRQNRPIEDTIEWALKFEDTAYRVVAVDYDGTRMVSTIWQGLALGAPLRPTDDTALIFETAFLVNGHIEEAVLAHSEEEALENHRQMCLTLLMREPRPEDGHVQRIVENDRR